MANYIGWILTNKGRELLAKAINNETKINITKFKIGAGYNTGNDRELTDLLDKSGVEYEKVNPFNNPELAMKYKVRTVPTTILVDQDEEIRRTIGFNPEELKEIITMI